MARHTLYAYVEGSDLDDVVDKIFADLTSAVASNEWALVRPTVVNQQRPGDDAGDRPYWDLGLNLELPDPGTEPAGWFEDVEQVARVVGVVAEYSGREFVLGIADTTVGITDDLFFVKGAKPDLARLRAIIGVDPPPGGPKSNNGSPRARDEIASQYFYRWIPWNAPQGKLMLHGPAQVITLDPWCEQIFIEARGDQTVGQFIDKLASEYEGGPPSGLFEQVISLVEQLVARSVIRLAEKPYALPPYLARPLFEQAPDVYRAQMIVDGFIKA